ncbi:MAG: hypothetical protein ACR2PT_09030 [Endozoicomonas sp.]
MRSQFVSLLLAGLFILCQSAYSDEFYCPSADGIVFNTEESRWEAALTKGMPAHWHRFVQLGDPKIKEADGTPAFKAAEFILLNSSTPESYKNLYPDNFFEHIVHCHYGLSENPEKLLVMVIERRSLARDTLVEMPFTFNGSH